MENSRLKFLLKSIFLSILAAFLISTSSALKNLFNGRLNSSAPWTFTSFWCVFAIVITIWLAHKTTKDVMQFIALTLLGPFLFFPFLIFYIYAGIFPIDSDNYRRYTGVSSLDRSGFDEFFVKGKLYNKDSVIIKSLQKLQSEDFHLTSFYFWQTGLAYGYQPDLGIKDYNGVKTIIDRFALILTVGPILLAEEFINVIFMIPHYWLFQIVYIFFKKEKV